MGSATPRVARWAADVTDHDEANEELLARRAAVFRRMREEERQTVREWRRRQELGIPPDIPIPKASARASMWSTIVGTLGAVLVLRFTPSLSRALEIPEALAFAGTGALLGIVFGLTRDADNREARVEHAFGFGAAFTIGFGGLSLL